MRRIDRGEWDHPTPTCVGVHRRWRRHPCRAGPNAGAGPVGMGLEVSEVDVRDEPTGEGAIAAPAAGFDAPDWRLSLA